LALDARFADKMGMLDRTAAFRRIITHVSELIGADIAWMGAPGTDEQIPTQYGVHATSGRAEGLILPVGRGVPGPAPDTRRPAWASGRGSVSDIMDPVTAGQVTRQAGAEEIKATIAVPVMADGRLLGVLYGAHRGDIAVGNQATQVLEQVAARIATAEIVAERTRHATEIAIYEERCRSARELHDTIGAMLFTIGAGIRQLGAEPGLDDSFRSRLSIIEQQATAAAALRTSLRVLSAPLEQAALGAAVREHCRVFQQRTGIPTRMITLTELPALDSSQVGVLADTARESLLNVEKNARAGSVVVSLFALSGGVAVAVSDDGGDLPDTAAARPGRGLAAVTARLGRVGGTVTFLSNEDGGIIVRGWLPV
jgi:signal transduction histidine kinase